MLDQVGLGSTDGEPRDERACDAHEPPSPPDERFANGDPMVIFVVALLGMGNFALHRAVLASGHPLLTQMARLVGALGVPATLALEFALLLAALLLVAGGQTGWAWVYLGYSALNAVAAWLILSRRI